MVRRIMSPEPAMTNFTLSITSSTFFAAARKYSGPFCIVMRPRNRTIFSSLWILYFSSSNAVAVGLDGVVDDLDLVRVDAVVVGDEVLGEVADGDDLDGAVHAAAFDVVDALSTCSAGAVELGGVHVDDQRHALERGDGQAGGEGHPVVGVNDVERFVSRDLGGERGVALDLVEQVAAVVVAPAACREPGVAGACAGLEHAVRRVLRRRRGGFVGVSSVVRLLLRTRRRRRRDRSWRRRWCGR